MSGLSNKISNVFGVPVPEDIMMQLLKRSKKNYQEERDTDTVKFLANKTAWVRLVSSVDIVNEQDRRALIPENTDDTTGLTLTSPNSFAKNFALFGGTSYIQSNVNFPRFGLNAYNILGKEELDKYGYRPMPGITDVQIQTQGRLGSIRMATINFKVWDKKQLDIMDALYFKLGYTMFLEWGNTVYFDNNEKLQYSELLSIDPFQPGLKKEKLNRQIADAVQRSNGNYDAMLGMCSNFNFTFNQGGGYECTIKLMGLGSLADSIKVNKTDAIPDYLKDEIKTYVEQKRQEEIKKRAEELETKKQEQAAATDKEQKKTTLLGTRGISVTDYLKKFQDPYIDSDAAQQKNSILGSNETDINNKGSVIYNRGKSGNALTDNGSIIPRESALYSKKLGVSIPFDEKSRDDAFNGFIMDTAIVSKYTKNAVFKGYKSIYIGGKDIYIYNSEISGANGKKYAAIIFVTTDIGNDNSPQTEPNDAFFSPAQTQAFKDKKATVADIYVNKWLTTKSISSTPVKLTRFFADEANTYQKNSGVITIQGPIENQDIPINSIPLTNNNQYVLISFEFTANIPTNKKAEIQQANVTATVEGQYKAEPATVSITVFDPSIIKEISAKDVVESTNVFKNYADNQAAQNAPKEPEQPTVAETVSAISDQEAASINSGIEYFLRAIQIHTYVKYSSSPSNSVYSLNLMSQDKFIQRIMTPGIMANITPNLYNGSIPDPEDLDIQKDRTIFAYYAKYGFNHNLMGSKKTKEDLKEFHEKYKVNYKELFKSYLIPYEPSSDSSDSSNKIDIQYPIYIPLGLFLMQLNNACMIYDTPDGKSETSDSQTPMVYIDFNPETNYCLSEPLQMSMDYTKFIVPLRATKEEFKRLFSDTILQGDSIKGVPGTATTGEKPQQASTVSLDIFDPPQLDFVSGNLPKFKDDAEPEGRSYKGKFMYALVNVQYLLDLCKNMSNNNESNAVYLREMLNQLVSDMNKCLGDINLFRLAYKDESNCLFITDDQVAPLASGEKYVLAESNDRFTREMPLYGVNSIAKSFSINTEVAGRLANMIAISANSTKKSAGGVDGTPFGHFNKNYIDRYKNQALPVSSTGSINSGAIQAASQFNDHVRSMLNSRTPSTSNISQATNYYINAMNNRKGANVGTKSSAMIPVNLNFTTDGISGLAMGQAFTISDELLPYTYTKSFEEGSDSRKGEKRVGFVIVNLDHKITSNVWETSVKANMIYLKNSKDFPSSEFINLKTGVDLIGPPQDKIDTDLISSVPSGNPPAGSNVIASGTGGHPITEKDRNFAKKYTNGVFPAVQLSDNTFKIRSTENLGKKGVRNWLVVNPEFIKTLVDVQIPVATGTSTVKVRPEFANALNKAFAEIKSRGLNKYIKSTEGGLAVRNVTGGNSLSFHSWGFALDVNASLYPYGSKFPNSPITDQDKGFLEVTNILAKYNIGWLKGKDPMHFSIYEIKA